jgi:Ca-activated chloride channel homolog
VKRSQLLIVVLAAAAVAAVAIISTGGGGGKDGGSKSHKIPGNATRILFAYSPEKEKLLQPLIDRFNGQGHKVDGHAIAVVGQVVSSGEAQSKIARGRLQPVAWSPSSSLWSRLLNFTADQPLAPQSSPSIVRTPLVIAMWEPFARALGWPKRQIGFKQLLRLANDPRGFASVGKPQYGDFKLVHTNPDFSTSGLSAVVAEYYAATGKKEGLTSRDVTASRARRTVKDLERSIVHYGDTTLFVADQLRKGGPGYASAVAMEEVTLLDFNRSRHGQPRLVALYPPEGTFFSDNPYIVLNAPWVNGTQKKGADEFGRFIADEVSPETAGKFGFRPADLKKKPAGPITAANGVDPAQPKRVLGLPEPRVLDRIKATWRRDRKPANVLLVVDTSGSMNDENRLVRAKQGLEAFFREVSPDDRVGLVNFSDQIHVPVDLGPFSANKGALRSAVRDLFADGGTSVYDATEAARHAVEQLHDRQRINAIVVLTDGEDTDSNLTADEVIARARAQGDSRNQVRVFTIAYSASAEGARQALEGISKASGGMAYQGDTQDIETVYRSISSFF